MFQNTNVCGHMFCFDCIREHVAVKIKENMVNVRCPNPSCKGLIRPRVCHFFVPIEVLIRWENALCESMILGSQTFYCLFKDCSALLVDDERQRVMSSECPNCNLTKHELFCALCKLSSWAREGWDLQAGADISFVMGVEWSIINVMNVHLQLEIGLSLIRQVEYVLISCRLWWYVQKDVGDKLQIKDRSTSDVAAGSSSSTGPSHNVDAFDFEAFLNQE
ncbi:zinc finger, C6HC-type containing protein [Tanacetum coccineum]